MLPPLFPLTTTNVGFCDALPLLSCPGCGAPAVAAGRLLDPVCDGSERAAQRRSPDHRELQLLRHPGEKCERFALSCCCAVACQRFLTNLACRLVSVSMLGPLTTPEHQFNKTPSSSSLSQRMKSSLTPR